MRKLFKKFDLLNRLKLYEGWFTDTFKTWEPEKISILHIDADYYTSVKLSLETFYKYVSPGGYVVLDDYGTYGGCKKAVDNFLSTKNHTLVRIDRTGYYFKK